MNFEYGELEGDEFVGCLTKEQFKQATVKYLESPMTDEQRANFIEQVREIRDIGIQLGNVSAVILLDLVAFSLQSKSEEYLLINIKRIQERRQVEEMLGRLFEAFSRGK